MSVPQIMEKFYNDLISVLCRSFGKSWCLTGETLAYFMCNYTLKDCGDIHIAADEKLKILHNLALSKGWVIENKTTIRLSPGIRLFVCQVMRIDQILEEFPKDFERSRLQFPSNIGYILDKHQEGWSENTKRLPYSKEETVFFDTERLKNGHEFIAKMLECGDKVGIRDRMFLGFGNALGYALRQDFLPKDDDIDMCIMADSIPQEQRHFYLVECKKAGLTEERERGPVSIDGKYVWFSIGPKSPFTQHGVKSCNWFWFNHGGYLWHSKGSKWIGHKDLSKDYQTAKGIPEKIAIDLKLVNFGGVEVQVPRKLGSCLDWWYGDWLHRKSESSAVKALLTIPKENDKKTWYIKVQ